MDETIDIETLRSICKEVPEARVIVLDSCQGKKTLQPALAGEPVHYVLKEIPVDRLADELKQAHSEEACNAKNDSSKSPSGERQEEKRTVVVLKVED